MQLPRRSSSNSKKKINWWHQIKLRSFLLSCVVLCFCVYQFLSNWPSWMDEELPNRTATGKIDCGSDFQSSKTALDLIQVSQPTSNVKILCYILTVSKYHTNRCQSVQSTWGSRCDRLIFASDVNDEILGAINIPNTKHDYDHLWDKHRKTLKYLYQQFGHEYDWFVKADDDTFLIVENLRSFLTSPEIQAIQDTQPLQLGHRLILPEYRYDQIHVPDSILEQFISQVGRLMYNSGGAGYAMNRLYIETFIQAYDKPTCLPNDGKVPEDAGLALCLAFEGVYPTYSRDARDRERFHLENPSDTYEGLPHWVARYHVGIGGPLSGPFSISPETIGFHYITPILMEYLEAQLYTCRI